MISPLLNLIGWFFVNILQGFAWNLSLFYLVLVNILSLINRVLLVCSPTTLNLAVVDVLVFI